MCGYRCGQLGLSGGRCGPASSCVCDEPGAVGRNNPGKSSVVCRLPVSDNVRNRLCGFGCALEGKSDGRCDPLSICVCDKADGAVAAPKLTSENNDGDMFPTDGVNGSAVNESPASEGDQEADTSEGPPSMSSKKNNNGKMNRKLKSGTGNADANVSPSPEGDHLPATSESPPSTSRNKDDNGEMKWKLMFGTGSADDDHVPESEGDHVTPTVHDGVSEGPPFE